MIWLYNTIASTTDTVVSFIPDEDFTGEIPSPNSIQGQEKNDNNTDSKNDYVIKVASFSETRNKRESTDPDVPSYDNISYSMSLQEVDYLSYVNKYRMPFNYLWSLLLATEDKQFVFDLADLVYDSEFVILIKDNIKTTTNTNISKYTYKTEYTVTNIYLKETIWTAINGNGQIVGQGTRSQLNSPQQTQRATTEMRPGINVDGTPGNGSTGNGSTGNGSTGNGSQGGSQGGSSPLSLQTVIRGPFDGGETRVRYRPDSEDGSETYQVKDIITNTEDTLDISLAIVDSWLVKEIEEYKYEHIAKHETSHTGPTALGDEDLGTSTSDSDPERVAHGLAVEARNAIISSYSSTQYTAQNLIDSTVVWVDSSLTTYHDYIINRSKEVIEEQEEYKYTSTPSELIEKTDKYASEPNFVTILSGNYNAKTNILSAENWLFKMLEDNEDTKDMVDITKYLLYRATGESYGVEDFNTVWENYLNSFETLGEESGTSGIEGNEGIVYDFLLSKGITPVGAAGIMGNIEAESNFNPNNLEDTSNRQSGVSDEQFTSWVNSGTISKNEFILSTQYGVCLRSGKGYGYGLAQWTDPDRKKNLYEFIEQKSTNFDISDINLQLEFLWKELEGYQSLKDYLMTVEGEENVGETAEKWNKEFEQSSDTSDTRKENAEKWYKEWQKKHINGNKITNKTDEHGFVFYQNDYDEPYGVGTIESDGCGPTSFAMIVSDLTGKQITPVDVVNWSGNTYANENGTTWNFFPDAAEHYGLKCQETYSISDVVEALKSGKKVVSSQTAGRFTSGGHFIALYSYDLSSGKIYVKNPNRYSDNTSGNYTPDEVNEFNLCYWIFSR